MSFSFAVSQLVSLVCNVTSCKESLDTELRCFTGFGSTILRPELSAWLAGSRDEMLLSKVADSGGLSPQKLLGQSPGTIKQTGRPMTFHLTGAKRRE